MPPRGHYLPYEVARLVGVPPHRVGQWARYGYVRSSQSESPRIYSYQDVIEAMVVHDLLETYGVRHRDIKGVVAALGRPDEYGAWPLTHAELVIAEARPTRQNSKQVTRAALLVREGDEHYDFTHRDWQQVERRSMQNLLKVAARDLLRGGWAVREAPDLQHIEVNLDRLSGRPTIRGRRVAAESVAALAVTPEGVEVLHNEYDLSPDEIRDAERWWEIASSYAA